MKKLSRKSITAITAIALCIGTVLAAPAVLGSCTAEKDYINLPILVYHEIKDEQPEGSYTIVSEKKFRKDMQWLKSHGFETIFLKEAADYVENGIALPPKPVAVTFDDGYESTYERAYPILKDMNRKATVVLIGDMVGAECRADGSPLICPYMTWDQAKEMYESGVFDIQSHTYGMHKNNETSRKGLLPLEKESDDAYRQAVTDDYMTMSKLIKDNTGCSMYLTAYPYGFSSQETDGILKEAGCRVTLGTGYDTNLLRIDDTDCLWNMNRIGVFEGISMRSIRKFLYQ